MSYTTLTQNKRTQLKSQMDDFATFQWRGHDMWEKYGCFIIYESKGILKFYNGPGYSNKYAKPQFSSSTNTLIGVDFKQKTISMKVGMYWFTIEEYQEFLNEIGPYVVNYLTFGYEKNYGYLVKLANIADSPRYIIGTNEKGNYVYYTEMDLNWELLGDNCVRSNLPYEYSYNRSVGEWNCRLDSRADMTDDSLLDTPILFELPLSFTSETAELELQAVNKNNPQDCNMLFHINLQNLTYSPNQEQKLLLEEDFPDVGAWSQFLNSYHMFIRYDSETGLIYIQEGNNDTWHLLNFQTDNNTGQYLLKSAQVNKWKIPGLFSTKSIKSTDWKFKLVVDNIDMTSFPDEALNTAITVYARKNIV